MRNSRLLLNARTVGKPALPQSWLLYGTQAQNNAAGENFVNQNLYKRQASSLDWSLSHPITLRPQATIVFIVDKSEPDYCIRTKSDLQANWQEKEGLAVFSRGVTGADEDQIEEDL